jgi:hypothetical protein
METLVGKKAPYFEGEAAVGSEFKKISLNEVFLHTGFPLMALAINFQDGPVYV